MEERKSNPSLCDLKVHFTIKRWIVTPKPLFSERWAFFTTPIFFSDPSQLINRGPFYLLEKQVVMIVSQHTYDERVSASMCFQFGMLHLLTHTQVWEGRSRYFWLRLRCCSKHHHPRLLSCFGSFQRKGHVPLKPYPVAGLLLHTLYSHDWLP